MVVVETDRAPGALGPYSQGIVANNMCFVSMELGIDPKTGNLVPGGAREQVRVALRNVMNIAEASGFSRIVKVTLYITDISSFGEINDEYSKLLEPPYPARSLVVVKELPLGACVGIDAIAVEG